MGNILYNVYLYFVKLSVLKYISNWRGCFKFLNFCLIVVVNLYNEKLN